MAKVKKATKTTTKTEPQPTRIPPPPANVGSVTPLYGNQALSPVLEDDGSIMGPGEFLVYLTISFCIVVV